MITINVTNIIIMQNNFGFVGIHLGSPTLALPHTIKLATLMDDTKSLTNVS